MLNKVDDLNIFYTVSETKFGNWLLNKLSKRFDGLNPKIFTIYVYYW